MKKQSPKEARMFFFFFSRELGSNWKQQWGVGYMKKNTQLYILRATVKHPAFALVL